MRVSFLVLFSIGTLCQAQSWELTDTRHMSDDITAYSYDERGALYIGTSTGEIVKYDADGEQLSFAFPNSGALTLIEGRNALLPFLFFRDNQRAIVLDRFLSNPVVYEIDAFAGGFAWLATPAIDRHLWLLKTSPPTILKVDPLSNSIIQSTPLVIDFPLEQVVYFKAHRNLLIVVDAAYGALVFDLFGNPILSLEKEGLQFAHIDSGELISYANGKVIYKTLRQGSSPKSIAAPTGPYQVVLRQRGQFHFIGRRTVETFTLTPE